MTRITSKLCCAIMVMLSIGCESAHPQNSPGAQGPEEGVIRRQAWLIPAQDRVTLMRTSVFRPPGDGPFPLAVISHGSEENELRRGAYQLPQYRALTEWLVAHDYVVAVPQRPGHGETGGPYFENQGGCASADFRKAGFGAADAIAAAIEYLTRQPFVRRTGVIALGQSAGAWASLALASRNPPPLRAVVAFAPGLGGRADDTPGRNCAPDRLVAAARAFGEKARVPTLWLYAENDSYFSPALSRRLVDAYRAGGGEAEYHLLPALAGDGHELIYARDGVPLWKPVLEQFFRSVK
jgi:dienelactone hydrolase